MRILLDTHIFLWCLSDTKRLPPEAKARILTASAVFFSSASIWEVAIKAGKGKREIDVEQLLANAVDSGFQELSVTARHATMVRNLAPIHNDPFDRILIAQAMCEPLRFFTADKILADYSDLVHLV